VKNDYVAEVSTTGNTLRNEGIAQHIVTGRSELRYETILSVLQERDTIVRDTLLGGSSVQDGNIHLAPRMTGNWIGANPQFDPEVHKATVDATPTVELRHALAEVGADVLGVKADGGARIGLVTDVNTGKTDGTISRHGDIIITGEKIKIAPLGEAGLGVFYVTADGLDYPGEPTLTQNGPKKIICRVPELAPGPYTLKIVTRFTSGNNLLKEPRTLRYVLPLNPQ
jgi:hypothetical protein